MKNPCFGPVYGNMDETEAKGENTMMNLAKKYRLPETATPESLEIQFFTDLAVFLTYGDKILMSGYYFNGRGADNHYGAVYTFTTDNHTCEGEIRLTAISDSFFPDDGHAIAWAMAQ
jgi:hypothetical protein